MKKRCGTVVFRRQGSVVWMLISMATLLLGGCGAESSGTVEKMDPASVRERAFRGFSKDQYRMGLYYEDGIHVHADLNNAVRWYQQAMKDGDARSRYRLGLLMWLGRTEGSADVAFNLVQTAAKAGLPEAQVTLGMWYANGVGTAYNRDEALLWFQRAAAEHDTIARYALAKLNRRRHASGTRAPEVVALHEQASRGNVKAQHQLAERYRQGNDVIQDYAEAAFWQKKAANAGYAPAVESWGRMLLSGQGGSRDAPAAFDQFKRAAAQGSASAQYLVGYCFEHGIGIDQDPAEAVRWYEKSARQNNTDAQVALGRFYELGISVKADPATAVYWYRAAAKRHHAWAHYFLGSLYASGVGVKLDCINAYEHLNLAAATLDPILMREARRKREAIAACLTSD